MDAKIILVDDEIDFLESLRRGLIGSGFKNIDPEPSPRAAAAKFEDDADYDVAVIDITMPEMNGIELLEKIRGCSPRTECIVVTALDEARLAVEALRKGAYDYLVKPISRENLVQTINRALERKRLVDIVDISRRAEPPALENPEAFRQIVTDTPLMFRILKEAELHAKSDVPVLITGETGTGKELLARAIHEASFRREKRFTPVNMDALDGQLFSAEFFGHTMGAFTGAVNHRAGYLEETHKGTLFLDEIGNLPLELQGKLLRVLQDGEFLKIGSSSPRKTDVRIIAATNADLDKLMAAKKFRKDLYYRLRGGWLHLPPLRERKSDIPLLAATFAREFRPGPDFPEFEKDTLEMLMNHDFPGNIRELKSIVQAAINLAQGAGISVRSLPKHLYRHLERGPAPIDTEEREIEPLAQVEKRHILQAYRRTGENKSETARLLEVSLSTLRRRLESYGVD